MTRVIGIIPARYHSTEQLRALENGFRIKVILTHEHIPLSVDTPEDLERARILARHRTGE